MDIRKSMEKKRVANAVELLKKGPGKSDVHFSEHMTGNNLSYLDLIEGLDQPTISKLSEILGVTKSAVTMKIAEFEKKGYVIKRVSEKDKRVKYLELSESMKAIYKAYEAIDEDIYREIEEKYSVEAVSNFCEILDFISDKIIESVED